MNLRLGYYRYDDHQEDTIHYTTSYGRVIQVQWGQSTEDSEPFVKRFWKYQFNTALVDSVLIKRLYRFNHLLILCCTLVIIKSNRISNQYHQWFDTTKSWSRGYLYTTQSWFPQQGIHAPEPVCPRHYIAPVPDKF